MLNREELQEIITRYRLQPHPEGGYFCEEYRSELNVFSTNVQQTRSALTHIYFLLLRGQVSRLHRVTHDELWHFYEGDPLRLLEWDGAKFCETTLGHAGQYVQVIQAGRFQAAESLGDYSLVGCSVGPGFDFKDFSFLDAGSADGLVIRNRFPEWERFL